MVNNFIRFMEAVNFDIIPKVRTIFFVFNCFELFHHQSFFAVKSPEHQMFLVLFAEITYITLIAIFMEKEAFLHKKNPYDFICYKILFQGILFTFLKDEN